MCSDQKTYLTLTLNLNKDAEAALAEVVQHAEEARKGWSEQATLSAEVAPPTEICVPSPAATASTESLAGSSGSLGASEARLTEIQEMLTALPLPLTLTLTLTLTPTLTLL